MPEIGLKSMLRKCDRWLLAGTLLACAGLSQADDLQWLRVVEQPGRVVLESVTRAYAPIDGHGPIIHLVGAIHIGDESYYRDVQALLDHKPVVLWEGVGGGLPVTRDPVLADGHAADQALTLRRARFIEAVGKLSGDIPESIDQIAERNPPSFRVLLEEARTDAWGNELQIDRHEAGGQTTWAVVSLGADGQPGGEGADADIRSDDHDSPLSTEMAVGLQADMASALGLAFQMDAMDYERAHWRNSDLSFSELRRAFRGEDVAARTGPPADRTKPKTPDADDSGESSPEAEALLSTLSGQGGMANVMKMMMRFVGSTPRSQASTKLMLAEMLTHADVLLAAQPGPIGQMMDVILHRRNDRVLYDLDQIRANEPDIEQVAVFYGGGHLQGLADGLVERGYEPAGELWIPAITIDLKAVGLTPEQAANARRMVSSMIQMSIPPKPRQPE